MIDAGAVAGYPLILEGKVRQVREVDADRLLIVATDRISAYDWIMPTPIPDKGRILTALSAFWFGRTADIVPNHLIETVGDRAMLVQRLSMLPIECVARGYLAGSGWRDYQETGAVCGHRLPTGLRQADPLPEPIFTPATKATEGHDLNISRDEAAEMVGAGRPGRGRADHPGAVPARRRALRAGRPDPGGHQVRARHRPPREPGAGGRGRDARLVAPVARRPLVARAQPALVR